MSDWLMAIPIGALILVLIVFLYVIIDSMGNLQEMVKEEKARAEEQKEWESTSENKECFANCREKGYMTYISAPGNCVCDTTKMVIK